jgi:histidinol-phosphate aminotransferase
VKAAIREAAVNAVSRFPEQEAEALRIRIARVHGVPADRVVLGCGASDVMRMAAEAFLGPQKRLVTARPTFDAMCGLAERAGAEVIAVPLAADYSHDLNSMRRRVESATRLVYICNPNNPTGTLTRRQEIEAFIASLPDTTHVLIDEAYHHYVTRSAHYASFIDRPVNDDRVIVVRSFSKIHGLAGLRLGYAISSPATARRLAAHQLADGVNSVAAKAAAAAIEDSDDVLDAVARNVDDRQEFFNQANGKMLRVIDSHSNFVMLNTSRPAAEIVEHFAKHDILLPPPVPEFPEHVRVSLGAAADMLEFWRVWDMLGIHPMSH